MMAIGPDQLLSLIQAQHPLAKLVVGQSLSAEVMGSTRHGLSLRVGKEPFLLDAPSGFAGAKTLTMQVTDAAPNSRQNVQILAQDGRPLSPPIMAHLTAKASRPTVAATENPVIRAHQIEVAAQPVARNGQAVGPNITVRLSVPHRMEPSVETNQASPGSGRAVPTAAGEKSTTQLPDTRQSSPLQAQRGPAPEMQAQRTGPEEVIARTAFGHRPKGPVNQPAQPARPVPISEAPRVETPTPESPKTLHRTIRATVADRTPAGQIILRATDHFLKVEQPIDLPLGADVDIILMANPLVSAGQTGPGLTSDEATPLTRLIELLDDIDRAGRHAADTESSGQRRQLPLPDRNLAAKLLGLIEMQPGQDPAESRPLEGEKGVAAARMDQIRTLVKGLENMAMEPMADGWKSLTLPVGSDPAQAVCLFHRDHCLDPDDDTPSSSEEGRDAKRAVFDVSLSHLGRCQIDALCQRHRFDLLVRSEKPLADHEQREITALFTAACEISGMTGDIGFRDGPFFEPAKASTVIKVVTT